MARESGHRSKKSIAKKSILYLTDLSNAVLTNPTTINRANQSGNLLSSAWHLFQILEP